MSGLYDLFHESSLKYPHKIFVKDIERTWTYAETELISRNISEYMLERCIQKGDRVVIFCNNSIQYIIAFFATLRINAVAVPINPIKMDESVLYIIEKCTPKLIFTCDATAEKFSRIGGAPCADIQNIDCIMTNCPQPTINEKHDTYDTKESDAALILFTSGTTAKPKGVTLTHGNLIANTIAIIDYLQLTCEDSILMTLPFSYSYGNSVLLTHVYTGATIIIENAAAFPYKVLEEIKRNRVSGFSTVGSYINLMLKSIKNTNNGFSDHLRYITLAGEATNNDDVDFLRQTYPDIKVYVMYGQTEASARLSYLDPELLAFKEGSIGKGLSNVVLKVVNDENKVVELGEIGEIIAYGPSIMKGYWEEQAATEEVIRDGWLYTGDNATVDEEGYIYIKGRKTDMIKHMGHRISPVEIEGVINSCEKVRESAVIETKKDGMTIIKAFIVLENNCSMDNLRKSIFSKLPVYMRPQIFEIIDNLPRTESGKIRRSALRSLLCAE